MYMNAFVKNLLLKIKPIAKIRNSRLLQRFKKISEKDAKISAIKLRDSWKEPSIHSMQDEHINIELSEYTNGASVAVFDVLTSLLSKNIERINEKSILEIGCSSGYYSEVLKIKEIHSEFTGCDYSRAFIDYAKVKYPDGKWDVEDATDLSYQDLSYDVVISGCCILHIYDFEKAIAEAARVSKEYVLFHRTPVIQKNRTAYYLKQAYGIEMLEIHFNENSLIELMGKYNLEMVDSKTTDNFPFWDGDDVFSFKSFLMKKRV